MLIHQNQRHQQGVSLVESLIALVVISVGLLGIASVQITAARQNASAFYHTQAALALGDIIEQLRSLGPAGGQAGFPPGLLAIPTAGTSVSIDTNNGVLQYGIHWKDPWLNDLGNNSCTADLIADMKTRGISVKGRSCYTIEMLNPSP